MLGCSPSTIGQTTTVTRASIRMLAPFTRAKVQDNPIRRPKRPRARNFLGNQTSNRRATSLLSRLIYFLQPPARSLQPRPLHPSATILLRPNCFHPAPIRTVKGQLR